MSKPKIMIYWGAACGGCDESIVDLGEKVLDVVNAVDIVFWPVALDYKLSNVEAMADGEAVATLFNGAVRSSEQIELAKLLRRKSQLMIAFGSCAHTGGIPSLANQFTREQILSYSYDRSPSTDNPNGVRPQMNFTTEEGHELHLPQLTQTVYALDQVVNVDYYVPGCPPNEEITANAIMALLSGNLPPKGTVLSPDVALCDTCERKDSKPDRLQFSKFLRPFEVLDNGDCFLAQSLICMGPSTRDGCGRQCINAHMPCRGCFGPTSRVIDHGAKMMTAIAAAINSNDEAVIKQLVDSIADPVGTFYRFGLAHSLLRRAARTSKGGSCNG